MKPPDFDHIVATDFSSARAALTTFTHKSWAESCDGRGAGIDFTDRGLQRNRPNVSLLLRARWIVAANERRTLMGRLYLRSAITSIK
jgi:hypothetical protein